MQESLASALRSRLRHNVGESLIVSLLFLCASVAVVATIAIFLTLLVNGWEFFRAVSLLEFLTSTKWAPDFVPAHFGALPLVKGTLLIGVSATVLGVPLGVGAAIYLSEYASRRTRTFAKPAIEVLAGVPSIIFAIVAVFVVTPFLQGFTAAEGYNALSAIIMLGVMVVPIIATIAEDALRSVPLELRAASMAVGATKWESTWGVVVPAASSGIVASVLLGLGRAIGETMVVALAAASFANMTFDPLRPMDTIAAFIANRAAGDLAVGSIQYLSIFAVGTVLFVLTFIVNILAQRVLARQRRKFA